MSEDFVVTATWLRGFQARVHTRGHEIAVDEPVAEGGDDAGVMPTDLLAASIASCFCLSLAFCAGKRGRELPGLEVVVRRVRAGRELRYERFEIDVRAEVPEEELAALMEAARRVCWVSNTLARGVELSYGYTSVDARTQR
ncbi:MAG TPA: OsmC family protein [Solirubrobacteraceae bacterium]|nr:OsmC family protein [Solirubrobacteraceae bacterium]